MEIVLGIDNIVFLSIVTGRLPAEQQPRARQLGLGLALGMRLLLLLMLSWILAMDEPIFRLSDLGVPQRLLRVESAEPASEHALAAGHWFDDGVSWKDLIRGGGLFLIGKSARNSRQDGGRDKHREASAPASLWGKAQVDPGRGILAGLVTAADGAAETAVGHTAIIWSDRDAGFRRPGQCCLAHPREDAGPEP
jgi:hypothetical protein